MPIKKITLLSAASLAFVFIGLLAFSLLTWASIPPRIEPLLSQDPRFPVRATDKALQSGFQDTYFGNNQRGRTLMAADFDLDGRVDFYIGNPGDKSFVLRNSLTAAGDYRFLPVQTLLESNHLAWGAVTGDFDNDGDYDLFVTNGANEGIGHDYMFRNEFIETGELKFSDVTQAAGVAGPVPPGKDRPIRTPSGNARLADYDQDGDKVRLTGDGEHISRDAIGTRMALNVTDKQGESRTLYRTLRGSSCFSAHNSFTVHYYIGDSISIDSLTITWPNGRKQILTDGLQANSSLLVNYDQV